MTRVKMYVCFGFSLGCLPRARTIDLQCQSPSLCRAVGRSLASLLAKSIESQRENRSKSPSLVELFALQRVSVGAPNHGEASRVLPFAGQLARKSDRKSSPKSIQNQCRERRWGTQNRVKIAPWTLSGRPLAPKIVQKASRERLGSVLGRPRRTLAEH